MSVKKKNVQISEELFIRLCRLHLFDDYEQEDLIRQGLEAKLDALARHEDYTIYRTSESPEQREAARIRYLDHIGLGNEWRW